jgi:hypothetical protein
MTESEQRQHDFQTIQAMKHFGGSFVKGLAELFPKADADNQRRLHKAFPEYWSKYRLIAEAREITHGSDWWDK